MSTISVRSITTPSPFLHEAFDDLVRTAFPDARASWTPPADVIADGDDILITLEVPGVAADDVDITLTGRILSIEGRRDGEPREDTRTLRRELRRGTFSRSFRMPSHVTSDAISAGYDAGMLIIRVAGATPAPQVARIPVAGLAGRPPIESAPDSDES